MGPKPFQILLIAVVHESPSMESSVGDDLDIVGRAELGPGHANHTSSPVMPGSAPEGKSPSVWRSLRVPVSFGPPTVKRVLEQVPTAGDLGEPGHFMHIARVPG